MPQILVRNLSRRVVEHLKKRAQEDGRSLQAELKSILEQAANAPQVDMGTAQKLCEQFRRRFKGRKFSDSAKLIRADRER